MISCRTESSGPNEVSRLKVSNLASEHCIKHNFCGSSSLGKGLGLDIGLDIVRKVNLNLQNGLLKVVT